MSVNVEKLEKNMAKLTVEVSAEDFEKAIQGAYLKQKNRINIQMPISGEMMPKPITIIAYKPQATNIGKIVLR